MPSTTVIPLATAAAAAGEVLQEFSDCRGVALRVDREKGVIHGVKLLGAVSKKGREYPQAVMARALPMYEGLRVNVDHVDPGQRRSLRDRIGLVKNVALREDGLYGDFHYNPKHALAEQIAWDAENAPQNLGFSHDSRGQSRNVGGRTVVDSIDKVLSVDLVANPATTNGLFEDDSNPANTPGTSRGSLPSTLPPEPMEPNAMQWKDIDLDGIKANRPELLAALQESSERTSGEKSDQWKSLEEELKTLRAEKAARELQEAIAGELQAAGLDPANKRHCSPIFLEDLQATGGAVQRKAKIDDRKALVAASKATAVPTTGAAQFQEDAVTLPPANAPLAQRLARFTR